MKIRQRLNEDSHARKVIYITVYLYLVVLLEIPEKLTAERFRNIQAVVPPPSKPSETIDLLFFRTVGQ